jgi:hypothetical protein
LNNRKNQNSILVLATLGVYLGIVLAGATPQILAQAATAKQFSMKDEIEAKDSLDKEPDGITTGNQQGATAETDRKIIRSFERFLAKFKAVDSERLFCTSLECESDSIDSGSDTEALVKSNIVTNHVSLDQILAITNLPRAGLDLLLATNAK